MEMNWISINDEKPRSQGLPDTDDLIPSYPTLDAAEEDLAYLGKYETRLVKVGEQKYLVGGTILCYEDEIYGTAQNLLRFFQSLMGKEFNEGNTDAVAELRDVIFDHMCESNDVVFDAISDSFQEVAL